MLLIQCQALLLKGCTALSHELAPLSVAFIVDLGKSCESCINGLSSQIRCPRLERLLLSFQVFHNLLTHWHESAQRSYSSFHAVLLLTLKQRIAVGLQVSGLVYPEPHVLAVG